jgi:iron(III) transport system substrate-binding protein
MTPRRALSIACAILATAAGCGRRSSEVVVYTSVDEVFAEPVLKGLEPRGTAVRAVFDTEETKSTGVLNRLVAESAHPQADVFWSGDPMRALILVKKGLASPYVSPNAADIPTAFKASDGSWTGFAARARVFLVNKNRVASADEPRSIRDLANPRFRGQVAIANPLYGTTTMHVAALFATWGDDAAKSFLNALRANEVRVASSNGDVKRLVSSGEVSVGLVDTDDAYEAIEENAPVDVVWPDQDGLGTLVMPTVVVLLRGGPHPEAGKALVDYLLTPDVERRMAASAAHMPLRAEVQVQGVRSASDVRAMKVDYDALAAETERVQPWLRAWVGL